MNPALIELIKISKTVGNGRGLTQGGSGNTSVKTDDGKFMFIKASGTAIGDMSVKKGWRRMNLGKVRGIIEDKKLSKLSIKKREAQTAGRLLAACDDKTKGNCRPSIESNLHAFLDKCVIHLHPTAVGAFVNSKNGKGELQKLFAREKFPPLWVPYANPGYGLAKKLLGLCSRYEKKYGRLPGVVFLQKHGLLISAATEREAIQLVSKTITRCKKKVSMPVVKKIKRPDAKTVKRIKVIIREAFSRSMGKNGQVYFYDNKRISAFANYAGTKRLLRSGPLDPGEIIYCNGPAVWVEEARQDKISDILKKQIKKRGRFPVAFLVKKAGLFVIGSVKSASIAQEVVSSSLFVRYNAQKFGGITALTKAEQDFI